MRILGRARRQSPAGVAAALLTATALCLMSAPGATAMTAMPAETAAALPSTPLDVSHDTPTISPPGTAVLTDDSVITVGGDKPVDVTYSITGRAPAPGSQFPLARQMDLGPQTPPYALALPAGLPIGDYDIVVGADYSPHGQ